MTKVRSVEAIDGGDAQISQPGLLCAAVRFAKTPRACARGPDAGRSHPPIPPSPGCRFQAAQWGGRRTWNTPVIRSMVKPFTTKPRRRLARPGHGTRRDSPDARELYRRARAARIDAGGHVSPLAAAPVAEAVEIAGELVDEGRNEDAQVIETLPPSSGHVTRSVEHGYESPDWSWTSTPVSTGAVAASCTCGATRVGR